MIKAKNPSIGFQFLSIKKHIYVGIFISIFFIWQSTNAWMMVEPGPFCVLKNSGLSLLELSWVLVGIIFDCFPAIPTLSSVKSCHVAWIIKATFTWRISTFKLSSETNVVKLFEHKWTLLFFFFFFFFWKKSNKIRVLLYLIHDLDMQKHNLSLGELTHLIYLSCILIE